MKFVDQNDLSSDQIESGDAFAPKFDANGLIMAITTDASDGQILMAAYMNAEALSKTLETGIVHYFSRSRNALWKKGETSGETQKLVEIRTDCDQDVLLIKATQTGRGAACHTGRKSCFFRKIVLTGDSAQLITDSDAPLFDPKEIYGKK